MYDNKQRINRELLHALRLPNLFELLRIEMRQQKTLNCQVGPKNAFFGATTGSSQFKNRLYLITNN